MAENITNAEALRQLQECRAELQTYKEFFANAAASIDTTGYTGNTHEESFATIRQAMDRQLVAPIRSGVRELQNTATYTGAESGTVKYSTVGGGDSGMSGYLQNARQPATQSNLKDADYAVLSHLAYATKWGDSAEYSEAMGREGITVREYCEELLRTGADSKNMTDVDREFLREMAASDRYGNMTIGHNVGNTAPGTPGEHAVVMIFETGDGHAIAAVQGTDGTVVDWRNNTEFIGPEPGKEEQYVASIINGYAYEYDSIDLTGHSQGGREAVTSAMLMSEENQAKIGRIVSNDGPGYSKEFQARYASQIEAIEGKVTNVRPSDSAVGELLDPVGNVQYVETVAVTQTKDGESSKQNSHLSTTWMLDEDGNYTYTDEHDLSVTSIAELTPALTDILGVVMPPDRTEYYLGELMDIMESKENPGKLEFAELVNPENWGRLKDLGTEFIAEFEQRIDDVAREQLSEDAYVLMRASQEMYDILDEIDGYLEMVEKVGGLICTVFPVAGPIILGIVEGVRKAIRICKIVFKVIEYGLKLYALYQAYKKKKAREKYIAQNDTMTVTTTYLREAADAIREAKRSIAYAYAAYDRMIANFVSQLTQTVNSAFGGSKEQNERISLAPKWEGKHYCYAKGMKNFDNTEGRTGDAAKLVDEIAQISESIISGQKNTIFTVTPRNLSSAAARGSAQAGMIRGKTDVVCNEVDRLKDSWVGEDYDSLAKYCKVSNENLGKYPENIKEAFDALAEIAKAYSEYQNQVIEKFQNSKLKF